MIFEEVYVRDMINYNAIYTGCNYDKTLEFYYKLSYELVPTNSKK